MLQREAVLAAAAQRPEDFAARVRWEHQHPELMNHLPFFSHSIKQINLIRYGLSRWAPRLINRDPLRSDLEELKCFATDVVVLGRNKQQVTMASFRNIKQHVLQVLGYMYHVHQAGWQRVPCCL